MATATFAARESMTESEVRYRYGPSRDRMDQQLTLVVATGETTGTDDRAPWVGGWLRRRQATTGQWPERASMAT